MAAFLQWGERERNRRARRHTASGDRSGLRCGDVRLHVIAEEQALLFEALRRRRNQAHISRMIRVALLERWARVAGRQSCRSCRGERQLLPGRIAPIGILRYRLGAQCPAGIGGNRHGDILAHLQQAAAEADRLFPLSLGAEGTCQIGGNLSTNAGGIAVLRYGNTRELTLDLEVVLADGRV
jgi:hypothetical protein